MRDIAGRGYLDRLDRMVQNWWRLALVLPQAAGATAVGDGIPPVVHAETGRDPDFPGDDPTVELAREIEHLDHMAESTGMATPAAGAPLAGALSPVRKAEPRPRRPPHERFGRGEV
jgi:hypothetical protein